MAGIEALDAERRKLNFGNAGSVNTLLSTAAERMERRLEVDQSIGLFKGG